MRAKLFGVCCGIAACLALATGARAQGNAYPAKPIRWVLGFPAGGASDVLARALANQLTSDLGQQVVVDNRPGASGIIANDIGAHAAPDGYTWLMVSSTYANLVNLRKKLPYDPNKDLVPVTKLASVPNILVVHPGVPVKTVSELVAFAKQRPGEIDYGTGGTGTGPHLATELFRQMTGIDIMHIPYKGTPPAVTDLLAGRVQLMFALAPVALPHVLAGKLRPLGVSGTKRLAALRDVPTVAETVPGFSATVWYGVLVPRGTPPRIVTFVNGAIARAIRVPVVQQQLGKVGFETDTDSPQAFAEYITYETRKWAGVIKAAHIPPI